MFRFRWLCLILITCVGGFLEAGVRFDLPEEVPDQQITDTDVIVKIPGTNYALKFPKDGSQPTTKDAVKNACANVNNDENSKITQFYMKLYGVIPYKISSGEEYYYDLGFDENGAVQKIIHLDGSFNSKLVPDPWISGEHITKHNLFHRAFKKLASTSVGRTLLYRLLIEIRRNKNGQGCLSPDLSLTWRTGLGSIYENKRNGIRRIKVSFSQEIFDYDMTKQQITVGNFAVPSTTLTNENFFREEKKEWDIALFHEMNHWYHSLRHTFRYCLDIDYKRSLVDTKILGGLNLTEPRLVLAVWGGDKNQIDLITTGNHGGVMFEELRNILGAPTEDSSWWKNPQYEADYEINGDDLCENLYRLERKMYLRFGHTNQLCSKSDALIVCRKLMELYANVYSCYNIIP